MFFNETKKYWIDKQNNLIKDIRSNKVLIEIAAIHPLINGDKPSEEFISRLDKGIELYHKEKENGNEVIIYVPGSTHFIMKDGVKQVDLIPLAEAGKNYLLEHGIPEKDIRANDANIKYQGKRGTYNSGDECLVACKIFNDENCGRLISLVSPGQAFRKAIFYIEFGVYPEMYVIPLDKTAHNYVGETFWSLFITTFLDHNWQGEKSFLATLTRKERFDGYELSEEEQKTLDARIVIPQEILDIKQKMMDNYKIVQEKTTNNILKLDSKTLIELSKDDETLEKSILEAKKIIEKETINNRNITICGSNENAINKFKELVLESNNLSFVVTNDAADEYLKSDEYGRYYILCKSDKLMECGINAIQKGVVPLITTIPTRNDDYITANFELYEKIIGEKLIDRLYDNK